MLIPPRIPVPGQKISQDIFRDIINYMKAITPKAGTGTKVSFGPNGAVIDSTATGRTTAAAKELLPFTLRYHVTPDDTEGQLEVYLPYGSMTTEDDCVPLNEPASNKSGHDDEDDWYAVVPGWQDNGMRITAYVMPGKHMIVQQAGMETGDYDRYEKHAIVAYGLGVPHFNENTGKWEVLEPANQGAKHTTSTAVWENTTNRLRWTLEKNDNGTWEVTKVELTDIRFDAGGWVLVPEDEAMEVAESAESVYLKVHHSDANYSVEAVTDPESTDNTDDYTFRQIYSMDRGYPALDYRWISNTLLFLR